MRGWRLSRQPSIHHSLDALPLPSGGGKTEKGKAGEGEAKKGGTGVG